ncbi:DUF3108 domain-containing protein [Myxococcaceae bacterium GXIMD 01537]
MNAKRMVLLAALALAAPAWAQVPEGESDTERPSGPPGAQTRVALCDKPLPALRTGMTFMPGEQLGFELDALGAKAGTMTMSVQRPDKGALPIQVEVQTNSFFSSVRRVKAKAMTYLHPKTLRPSRYTEDAVENETPRKVNVLFGARDRSVKVDYSIGPKSGRFDYTYDKDVLDVAGALYAMRQLPLKEGMPVCFDVYGIRRMWRLTGTVQKREKVNLPLGQFTAWHLAGTAVRLDKPSMKREVHVWLSDDARRLPLAAVGTIDIGTVRATLTSVARPGEKRQEAGGKEDFKW